MAPLKSEWLTPEEVAALLKITPKTVKDYLRAGKLPGRKMGKLWRIKAEDVNAFMEQLPQEAPAAGLPDAACPEVLLALVKALLPERQPVYVRDYGIERFPLHALNQVLEAQGYKILARKVRDPKRGVACTEKAGRVEQFGLFELRRLEEPPC
jgi:excisionase family DNA binding protein